ncbi:hypothetical protein DJ564_16735 [Pseudomonas sp. 31-12]|uniref:hypothetical protein n=1 Tax=Pseudomonas sp. 31-12 TaxID=2201356 RepID=UPI000D6B620C|nr:hypothetical protein [Pseudomonas sp. 31-12]AWM92346.1 hypothetical protein DJ564_16735 [Pseudomonas sp. 31-12]
MNWTSNPFPIFPTMWVFVRCLDEGMDFPANIHVLRRLSDIDPSCRPVEMCRHAADFILESMQIKQTPWAGRYSDYTSVLHMALNWSFLVDRRPMTEWDTESLTRFLHFIKQPDDNWVAQSPAGFRFLLSGYPALTNQPINPSWRPCYRPDPKAPIVSTVMRQVHGVTFHFLQYLWRIGVRKQPAPVMAKPPETPSDKGLDAANLSPLEMDWLFAHLERWRLTSPEYEMCRFMLAVARFTTIPLSGLSRDGQHVGLLSQFMTYQHPPEPVDPPRCSSWVYIDNPGAPLETERPLCTQFIGILKDYVESRGLPTGGALPDVCTLTETQSSKVMASEGVQTMIRRHRVAIADAARNDETLLDAAETAAKLAQLTFSQVRRSARANLELACKKPTTHRWSR